jgi:hypothetical protein
MVIDMGKASLASLDNSNATTTTTKAKKVKSATPAIKDSLRAR